jgi:LacI family transcriptional regulator
LTCCSARAAFGDLSGNDTLALGVLKAARNWVRVPEEVAVLGFDDADFAEYIGLSTVSQAFEESGPLAVELLLSLIADPDGTRQHVRLPLRVISPRHDLSGRSLYFVVDPQP